MPDLISSDVSEKRQAQDAGAPEVVYDDVSIRFDEKPVLENISFTVAR